MLPGTLPLNPPQPRQQHGQASPFPASAPLPKATGLQNDCLREFHFQILHSRLFSCDIIYVY